jgi:glycosyltransferase involved in cell wall biosynthesis
MIKPLLSIIVAAHHEGLIAHKTILSLNRATKKLEQSNIDYEIIVTIDNGDNSTIEYFNRYNDNKYITVHHVSFGDLSQSRNYGVSLSNGKYIATVDADDLVSENWFIEAIKILEKSKDSVILHTQYSVNFGTQNIVWEKFDSRSKEEDALIMTWANRWDSAIMAPRHILEAFPYQPNTEGYGSEDWHFNSNTIANDIAHKVVPQTVLFVRRKDVSEMTIQTADRRTVRYTSLLDFDFIKNIDISPYKLIDKSNPNTQSLFINQGRALVKRGIRFAHNKAKSSQLYTKATNKIISSIRTTSRSQKRFPTWLTNEWRAIHVIEKNIFPSEQLLQTIPIYHSEMHELGMVLVNLATYITKQPDYIIFVPYLIKGGAELVALNYVKSIQSIHPQWHIAVVATLNNDNPWKDMLPKDVDFIPFGNLTHQFAEQLQLQLLARFIVQSKTTRLHISQSALLYRFTSLYKTLLEPYKIYSFAFCEDTDNEGRISGHVHSGLPLAYDSIDRIITDNNSIVDDLVSEYGYDRCKFVTHYQPVDLPITPPRQRINSGGEFKILWASRIAKQKRPDILINIAKQLSGLNINIYVYGSFQDGYSGEIFEGVSNIFYKGCFNGIDSIPTDEYDMFLYTSENDGVPNILLEITAKGLAIAAPNVGGIREFINSDTGMLINQNDDINGYIKSIKQLADDDKLRIKLVERAQKKLLSQHSTKSFYDSIAKDII